MRGQGSTAARPLGTDEFLQILALVLVIEALWRFFGQFPGYWITEGIRGVAACRVCQAAAAVLVATRTYGRAIDDLGVPRSSWRRDLGTGLVVAAVLAGLAVGARQAFLAWRGADLFDLLGLRVGVLGGANVPTWQAALILGGIGPAVEDLLFWGIAMPVLRAAWGPRAAFPVVLAAFVALHWEGHWRTILPPAAGGILFAGLVAWRGSVLASIPLHGAANLLIVLVNRRILF